MSRRCDICQKGPNTANSRSHSKVATKRRQLVNLHSKKIAGKTIKVCSRCLKSLKKTFIPKTQASQKK